MSFATTQPTTFGSLDTAAVLTAASEGVPSVRIPAIVDTPGGLLLFAEARSEASDFAECRMVMAQSTDRLTWSASRTIFHIPERTNASPTPIMDWENGVLWLLWISAPVGSGFTIPLVNYSLDNGATWVGPRGPVSTVESFEDTFSLADMAAGDWVRAAPGPGHGIVHSSGTLLAPYWWWTTGNVNRAGIARLDRSDTTQTPLGTWKVGVTVPTAGANESTIVELSDGRVLMSSRDEGEQTKRRIISITSDFGITWDSSGVVDTLTCPTVQGTSIRLPGSEGAVLLANPQNTDSRQNLAFRASLDDGSSWLPAFLIVPAFVAYSDVAVVGSTLFVVHERSEGINWMAVRIPRLWNGPPAQP